MRKVVLAGFLLVFLWPPASGERDETIESAIARISTVLTFHRRSDATPREIALGRRLFFDADMSVNGKMSCATCHIPSKHYADGLPRAIGRDGKPVARRTLSLLKATYYPDLFWDGRASTIDEAALIAIQNPAEMAQPLPALVARLAARPEYETAFHDAYPKIGVSTTTIGRALAAFVISLAPPEDSPFDRYLAGRTGLSPAAERGFRLFAGKGRCIECHTSGNLGYNHRFQNIGLAPMKPEDPGRYLVDPRPEMWGAFRVPALRNVAVTGPYMHDGRFATLKDVIDFYDRGGDKTRYENPILQPLHLTAKEKDDLLAFLGSLTTTIPPVEATKTR